MIRPGFLDIKSRQNLIELARDGLAAHRLARRANALVLLDDGMSCEAIAKVLLLDDDTIRTWYRLYEEDGIEGLTNFSYEGSACQLSGEQQEKRKAWVATSLPRTTRQVGAWIENEFGVVYEGRSGLIALLHRLGLEYHKPNVIPRKLDEEKQKAFIEGYEKLLNSLGDDEAVLFADAVHPTHAARPVGCWAPSQEKLAIEQTSGRQRINIHGAIDLETLLFRVLAYRLQADHLGDLDGECRRLLDRSESPEEAGRRAVDLSRRTAELRPGTVLGREWNGRMHRVAVLAENFAWNGKSYPSLSKVALAITGTRWNGPKFFGLRDKPSKGSTA